MNKKQRTEAFKNSMTLEQVTEVLLNMTQPMILVVIHKDFSNEDRTRLMYPTGRIEFMIDKYFEDYDEEYLKSDSFEYVFDKSCFIDDTIRDYSNDLSGMNKYDAALYGPRTEKSNKLMRNLVIAAMMKYDYEEGLRIIDIIPA